MPHRVSTRSKVNRWRIERAGRAIVRSEGVPAISVRSVAARLDVTPMALYSVIGSADELRAMCVDFVLRDVPPPPVEGTPRARLRAWADAARPVFARSRGLAEVCLADWPGLPQGCRILDGLLGVAGEALAVPGPAAAAAHAVFVAVLTSDVVDRATRSHRRARWPALTPRRDRAGRFPLEHPHLARCERALRSLDPDDAFGQRMDELLDAALGDAGVTSG
jgi:AcrR family transcriptional regulator